MPTEENAIGWIDGVSSNDVQNNQKVYMVNRKELVPDARGKHVSPAFFCKNYCVLFCSQMHLHDLA